jgi:hypothetical protein
MAASSATGMSAICTIAHKPASDPAVPAEDQLAVRKGDVVEVLHQNFDTQWWECRFARKASPGEVWDARVHSKKGLLPSGNLLVTLRPPDVPCSPLAARRRLAPHCASAAEAAANDFSLDATGPPKLHQHRPDCQVRGLERPRHVSLSGSNSNPRLGRRGEMWRDLRGGCARSLHSGSRAASRS